MDESSYYYDDGLGFSGYILNTCTFSLKDDIYRLVECLEVNLKLESYVFTTNTKGIYILLVRDVTLFNNIVFPCLLPEFYKKLHFNEYPPNKKAEYNKGICKHLSTNKIQNELIIGNMLGGITNFIKTKNSNLYVLRFELPKTEVSLIFRHYLIMHNIVGVLPQKNLNKNIVFFKTFSHKNMFKRFKLLL